MSSSVANFRSMDQVTAEDWDIIVRQHEAHHAKHLVDEVLGLLKRLKGPKLGFPVDRYEHSLQTATRAMRDDADEETVVCALLHDIGDGIALENHCEITAGILRPYVSPENLWMIENHVVFSGYHFAHFVGRDRNAYLKLKDHPAYEQTLRFVRDWDGPAFDPDYDSLPLETFEPMVRRLFARQPRSAWREVDAGDMAAGE